MIKLLDDIYTWSVFSDEKQLNFNGWFIQNQSSSFGNVVIDPPQPSEKDLTQMQKMGGVRKLLLPISIISAGLPSYRKNLIQNYKSTAQMLEK